MKKFNYMNKTGDLIDSISKENPTEENIVTILKSKKQEIGKIASYVKGTGLFEERGERYEEYKNRFFNMENRDNAIRDAWTQFLIKVNSAPTNIHLRGVVILNMPIIEELLNQ